MKKHYRKETNCLNCGSDLQGKYCHNCGQENLEIKESFGHMMNHAVSDYFHFDHQFFHTLKPLLFQPGKLTNEYMAGKRVQYLHPIKMYIFISLVYFVLLFGNNSQAPEKAEKPITTDQADSAVKNINKTPGLTKHQKELMSRAIIAGTGSTKKGGKRKNIDPDVSTIPKGVKVQTLDLVKDSTYDAYLQRQRNLPPDAPHDGFFRRFLVKKNFAYKRYGKNASEVFWENFKHNVPKMMFVLLPLFALILRFAFWKNKKFYVEHLIYSFHLHCFLFLLFSIIMLIEIIIPENAVLIDCINFLVALATTWYIYKSLKNVYHRSRFRTITKMIGMSVVYFFVSLICLGGLIFITAITIK